MIFIIGGAAQGKYEFAKHKFPDKLLITEFHNVIAQCIKDGMEPMEYAKKLCTKYPEAVILMDELGCGVVPVEKEARELRDTAGHVGCYLAGQASEVYRVTAGIGMRIK